MQISPEELAMWKQRGGADPLVIGVHGRVVPDMNPRQIEFKSRAAKGCAGCLFEGQRSAICNMVGEQAALRGLPACDDGVIYIEVEKDPRQCDLIEED